jgi:hypothetical protein
LSSTTKTEIKLALYGAIGAIAPDILLFYSKRFTMPSVSFSRHLYIAATVLYVGLAAVVATAYPYGSKRSPVYAMGVGLALPVILSSITTALHASPLITRGMGDVTGSFLDLLRLW